MSEGGGFGRLGYLNSKCELCLLVFNPRIGKLVDAPILGANKKAHLNCIKFLLRQAREQGHSCPKLLENGKDRQCAGCHEVKASLRCSGGGNSSPCASFFHLSCVVGSGGEINYQEDRITCREHRTGQSKALGNCLVCGWRSNSFDGTVLECCKKAIHISCAQLSLASSAPQNNLSATCPACHNSKEFETSVRQRGVYVQNSESDLKFIKSLSDSSSPTSLSNSPLSLQQSNHALSAPRRHSVGVVQQQVSETVPSETGPKHKSSASEAAKRPLLSPTRGEKGRGCAAAAAPKRRRQSEGLGQGKGRKSGRTRIHSLDDVNSEKKLAVPKTDQSDVDVDGPERMTSASSKAATKPSRRSTSLNQKSSKKLTKPSVSDHKTVLPSHNELVDLIGEDSIKNRAEAGELVCPTHNDSGYSTKSNSVSPTNSQQNIHKANKECELKSTEIPCPKSARCIRSKPNEEESVCGRCTDNQGPLPRPSSLSPVLPHPDNPLIFNSISHNKNQLTDIESRQSCPEERGFVAIISSGESEDCPGSERRKRKGVKRRHDSDQENIIPKRSKNEVTDDDVASAADKPFHDEEGKPKQSAKSKGTLLSLLQGLPGSVISAFQRNVMGREVACSADKVAPARDTLPDAMSSPRRCKRLDLDEVVKVSPEDLEVALNRVECSDELHFEADDQRLPGSALVKLSSSPRDLIHPEDSIQQPAHSPAGQVTKKKPARHRRSLREVFITDPTACGALPNAIVPESPTTEKSRSRQSVPAKTEPSVNSLTNSDNSPQVEIGLMPGFNLSDETATSSSEPENASNSKPDMSPPAAATEWSSDPPRPPPSKRRKSEKCVQDLSTRHIVHGRNFVPWRQDEEPYLETQYSSIPELLRRNVADFVDVNPGEKELIKLWNNFFMENVFVGRTQLHEAINKFIEQHAPIIASRNLYKNFLLLLGHLEHTEAIDSTTLRNLVVSIQTAMVAVSHGHDVTKS